MLIGTINTKGENVEGENMTEYFLIVVIIIALLADTLYYTKKKIIGIRYLILNVLISIFAICLKLFLNEASYEDGIEGFLGMYTVGFNILMRKRIGDNFDKKRMVILWGTVALIIIIMFAYFLR